MIEAMKQGVEAFCICIEALRKADSFAAVKVSYEAIDALRQAIAQAEVAKPEQEPVAWEYQEYRSAFMGNLQWFDTVQFVQPPNDPELFRNIKPLYTAPPRKEWVGLTDDEVSRYNRRLSGSGVAEEIQAKLRERNT
jgi:hypothetical protein